MIKASLAKSMVPGPHCAALCTALQQRVEAASRGVHRLSLAANLFVRTAMVHSVRGKGRASRIADWRHVQLPPFLSTKDVTFARHLMLGQEGTSVERPAAHAFLRDWSRQLPPTPARYPSDSNTYVAAASQYLTNYRTQLQTTFQKRQASFFRTWVAHHPSEVVPEKEAYLLRWLVNGWGWPPGRTAPAWASHPTVTRMAAYHREVLGLGPGQAVCDRWWDGVRPSLATAPRAMGGYERAVVYSAMISEYLRRHRCRELSLAPLTHMRAMFIHVDSDVFYGLLKDAKVIDCNKTAFTALRAEHWDSTFRVKQLLTSRQRGYARFTGTIQTDGVSLCVHYERPSLRPAEEVAAKAKSRPKKSAPTTVDTVHASIPRRPGDRVIGVDPGRSTLFMGVERTEDGFVTHKLSRPRYYQEAGIVEARRKTEGWSAGIRPALDALSLCTHKGASLSGFARYVDTVQAHSDALWGEYLKRRYARQRLTAYSGKQRVLARFLAGLDDGSGRRVLLAYGDGSVGSGGPGEQSVPCTRLLRECKRRFAVQMVDEFRTSQVHAESQTRLARVVRGGRTLRGLKWCGSTRDSNSKFVDRDVNAALNILNCYWRGADRPTALCRRTATQDEPPSKHLLSTQGHAGTAQAVRGRRRVEAGRRASAITCAQ